ncbi:MAG: RHS repeat-associated core domain-containing protein [Desulfobacterales bacterium]
MWDISIAQFLQRNRTQALQTKKSEDSYFTRTLIKHIFCIMVIFILSCNITAAEECPRLVPVGGGESLEVFPTDQTTGAPVSDGMIFPPWTHINFDVLATADGSCLFYNREPYPSTACPLDATYERAVGYIAIHQYAETGTPYQGWYTTGYIYPDPANQCLKVLDSQSSNTMGPVQGLLPYPGIYTFYIQSYICITVCHMYPDLLQDVITFYVRGNNEKDLGEICIPSDGYAARRDSGGNKHYSETDFSDSGTDLSFKRHYNSRLQIDFGLGHGWTSNHHKRLEKYANTLWARRGDGRAEHFTLSGSDWQGDPDCRLTLTEDAGGFDLKTTDDTVERYDLNGRLLSVTDSTGRITAYNYNTNGKLENVTGPFGHTLTFAYNDYGKIEVMYDTANNPHTFSYDAKNNLGKVDHPDGTYRIYHYELEDIPLRHSLTGISDERGIRLATYEYYSDGRIKTIDHPNNADKKNFVYGTNTYTVTNGRGISTAYTTIKRNNVTLVTQIVGPACCGDGNASYSYDSNNNLLSKTVNGKTTKYGDYDSRGNPGYKIEAFGTSEERRTDYTYDSRFHGKVTNIIEPSIYDHPGKSLIFGTDANGNRTLESAVGYKVTSYQYDDFGNTTNETIQGYEPDGDSISRTTTYEYNGPLHQLSQVDGPRTDVSDITTYEYYPDEALYGNNRARLKRVIDPTGTIERDNIQYTLTGKIASENRPNALTLNYTYYPGNDRLETLTETNTGTGQSKISRWTYLATGEVESVTLGYGSSSTQTLTFGYDDALRLTDITDGMENYIEYTLDAEGNQEAVSIYDDGGVLKKHLTKTFDAYNRLDIFGQMNESVNYDFSSDGTLSAKIDGNNVTTSYGYDNLKRLTEIIQDVNGTDPETENASIQLNYDAHDQLTTVQNPNGNSTAYANDDLGNMLQEVSTDSGTTVYGYDEAGNMTTRTDAKGQSFAYSYDGQNRLTSVNAPDTDDDVSYVYDTCTNGDGYLCSISMNTSQVDYAYDAFGRVAGHQGVSYSYNEVGQTLSMTYPSGAIVTYSYNSAGQVVQVELSYEGENTILANNITYKPFGPVTSITYGNNLSLAQASDQAYRFSSITVPNALGFTNIQYDGNGNLIQEDEGSSSPVAVSYDYDALNRLEYSDGINDIREYGYDKNGNRMSLAIDGNTTSYSYEPGSNRLSTEDSWIFTSDANGNIIEKRDSESADLYGYNTHNRLTNATVETLLNSYSYNGLGQRITKTTDSIFTQYRYGINGELLAEMDSSDVVQFEYIYLNGQPLAMLSFVASAGSEEEYILDNGDTGTSSTGTWTSDTDKKDKQYGDDFLYASGGTGSTYRWSPALTEGSYEVYAWWVKNRKNSSNVSYTIDHNGTIDTVIVDQTGGGGTWALLGQYDFIGDGYEYVEVDDSSGRTVADAVRFLKIDTGPPSQTLTVHYIHNDHLGTPHSITDESGQIVWSAQYNPFGQATTDDDPDGNGQSVVFNFRFPGQYYDEETGLHYNYYRYYDPRTGRYLTPDPIGIEGGMNLYAYVGGNPVNYTDPTGLFMPVDSPFLADEIGGWTATGEKIANNAISKSIQVGSCTAKCTIKMALGDNIYDGEIVDIAWQKIGKAAVDKAIKKGISTATVKLGKKFFPIYGQVDTAKDVAQFAICEVKCCSQ